jgi:hypothetical protein
VNPPVADECANRADDSVEIALHENQEHRETDVRCASHGYLAARGRRPGTA